MKLFEFFDRESDAPKVKIVFMAILAGMSNSIIIAIINTSAEVVASDHPDIEKRFFFIFIISLILFIFTRWYSLTQAVKAVERVIFKIRIRIADKIRHADLLLLEELGKSKIYTYLTKDTTLISQSALVIVTAAQSIIVVLFCIAYLAFISPLGCFIIIVGVAVGSATYLMHYNSVKHVLEQSVEKETEFFSSLNHILDGFKEIKINQKKSDDLFSHVQEITDEAEKLRTKAGMQFAFDMMFSRVASTMLLGIIVFILPVFSTTHGDEIIKITATFLFMLGSVDMIVSSVPVFAQAAVAVNNVQVLEASLDAIQKPHHIDELIAQEFNQFKQISFDNITFDYIDKTSNKTLFHVGPLNFNIKRGEIIFIVGGNGCGKSTLLKLLTGLYIPLSGSIMVDVETVDDDNCPAYRDLYAAIFTDFHLFARLYGLKNVDRKEVNAMLRTMQMDKKTKYVDGKFTNINLSTGQKKRLAFIAAALENKPVYIFDEIAADQDPHFRQFFYEATLSDLKSQGKTIISVTHDDRYFHLADRVLKMEYGQLIEQKKPDKAS